MYLAVTRIFCLILAADSRGDRGRASALHKSKLLELIFLSAVSLHVAAMRALPSRQLGAYQE